MDQGSSPQLPAGSLTTNKLHGIHESLLIGVVRGISIPNFQFHVYDEHSGKRSDCFKACSGSGPRFSAKGGSWGSFTQQFLCLHLTIQQQDCSHASKVRVVYMWDTFLPFGLLLSGVACRLSPGHTTKGCGRKASMSDHHAKVTTENLELLSSAEASTWDLSRDSKPLESAGWRLTKTEKTWGVFLLSVISRIHQVEHSATNDYS
jgi:hypothetical protein